MKEKFLFFLFLIINALISCTQTDVDNPSEEINPIYKLSGDIIGSEFSFDLSTGEPTNTQNTKDNAFDGDPSTFFMSYDSSMSWVGLDLGEKYVITRVGFTPYKDQNGKVELAIFEGANDPTFFDSVPIAMAKEVREEGGMQFLDVNCSKGFKYVRYVSPNNSHCQIAELEFYGYKGEGEESQYFQLTNLPTVVINTKEHQEILSKEEEISSNVYLISDNGKNFLSTSETLVRGRGNYSWILFPKKPYRIKFAEKQNPFGAPAKAKKWTLISNHGDKTLMRNILAFEVSRRIGMSYTPFCIPVDVIVNGEYRGCYQFSDQVEVGDGRVTAKDGYLIEIDAYANDEKVKFFSNKEIPVTVKYPKDDKITEAQLEFRHQYFNDMESSLFSDDYTNPVTGYRKYLDIESFLKNFIIGEFCGNTDTFWSVYMYKDGASGKLYTGPVWDYDLAFENDFGTYPINQLDDFIYAKAGSVASPAVRDLVSRIVKEDISAHNRLIELWNETKIKVNDLNDFVDETASLLDESQTLNFKRWPILNEKVHNNFQATGSYSLEVKTVKDYISNRIVRMDELINGL